MNATTPGEQRQEALLATTADEPNLPEVSGTSFPLLTTVLAGFAVTIAVQLIIRPDSSDELGAMTIAAIIVFLASTLLFISSIVFAVNAQGHNYLPFIEIGSQGQDLMNIQNHRSWIAWLQQGWDAFHLWAVLSFYGGILLLLAGVNLIVWEFVGAGVAIVFLTLIIANVALTVVVGLTIQRRKERSRPAGVPGGAHRASVWNDENLAQNDVRSDVDGSAGDRSELMRR